MGEDMTVTSSGVSPSLSFIFLFTTQRVQHMDYTKRRKALHMEFRQSMLHGFTWLYMPR
jgi:hypothetical protein